MLILTSSPAAQAQQTATITLDKAVVAEITANYRACLADELAAVDDNGNGKLDADEDVQFFADGEAYCQEELQRKMAHSKRMAAGERRLAELKRQEAEALAEIEALTDAIIAGAQAELGL